MLASSHLLVIWSLLLSITSCTSSRHAVFHIPDYSTSKPEESVYNEKHFRVQSTHSFNMLIGHIYQVNNPLQHFAIVPPVTGCGVRPGSTPKETSQGRCLVTTNGGFFNTTDFECYGNLVTDGEILQTSEQQNANFGITKDAKFIVGYLSQQDLQNYNWHQLISGLCWLVRDGENFVTTSLQLEDMSIQESTVGEHAAEAFAGLAAARTAIGHDKHGRLLLITVDKNGDQGATLYDMAELMISMGAVNAINLDGGGSTQVLEQDLEVNQPSDYCTLNKPPNTASPYNNMYTCPRRITTIVCIHEVDAGSWPVPTLTPTPTPTFSLTGLDVPLDDMQSESLLGENGIWHTAICLAFFVSGCCALWWFIKCCSGNHVTWQPVETADDMPTELDLVADSMQFGEAADAGPEANGEGPADAP
eukprot:TRINITY_DN67737_c2_g1_i1.p1 TRINITY_DN67737_c2_g1~~TRINITY_DN67737_c2_g1_i1.p1  ORF type:complete len:418 (-),score=61.06 TRINITY_DN67737_c2_g1_i1:603-1856(-)